MAKRRIQVTIVPHTHWDRAWNAPSTEYLPRVTQLMDRLLDLLERNPSYSAFVLDGQTLPLETYLHVRPNARERVVPLVEARRLLIGPGYVLPDEFLASAESLVRNLLIGTRSAKALGHVMRVGYSPDPFGHVGQMPQILRGFGLDSFVFSRGVDRGASPLKNEFVWEGPDGSTVLAVWQRDFYLNACSLGYRFAWADRGAADLEPDLAVKRAKASIESLLPHNVSRTILLNNGTDYSEAQEDLVEILRLLQKELPEYQFRIGSLEDHIRRVRQDLKHKRLQRTKGELLYPFKDLLRGVNSTRMPLKQAQHEASMLLERYAEPLSTYAWLTSANGHDHYPALLDYAWRDLLETQPHDDIGGCSVDEVAREDLARLEQVRGLARHIARESLRAVGRQVDTSKNKGVGLLVFNPVSWTRSDLCRAELHIPMTEANAWQTFTLRDLQGGVVPYLELGRQEKRWMEVRRGFHVGGWTKEAASASPALISFSLPSRRLDEGSRLQVGGWTKEAASGSAAGRRKPPPGRAPMRLSHCVCRTWVSEEGATRSAAGRRKPPPQSAPKQRLVKHVRQSVGQGVATPCRGGGLQAALPITCARKRTG